MKTSLKACSLACVILAGCRSSEPIADNDRVQTLRRAAPSLPYTARIVVDGGDEETRSKIASLVHEALLASDALIGKCVTESGENADITIRIDVVNMPGSGELPKSTTSVGPALLSSGLWLFGGIPGWFTRDTTFNPWGITMKVGLEGEPPQLEDGTRKYGTDLNFYERASWPLYFVQIIIPPPVLPPSESPTKESLIEKFSEPLQMWVMDQVKLRWPLDQLTGRHAMAQVQDDQVVIFSPATVMKAERDGMDIGQGELQKAYVTNRDAERLYIQRLRDTVVGLKSLYDQRRTETSGETGEESKPDAPAGVIGPDAVAPGPDAPARQELPPDPLLAHGVEILVSEYEVYTFPLNDVAKSFRTTDSNEKTVSWTLRRPAELAAGSAAQGNAQD